MAADCKSAAPWSYGGSNPPLCTTDVRAGLGEESEPEEMQPDESRGFEGAISVPVNASPAGAGLADTSLDRRFRLALALYAVLGLLVWFTMGEGKILVHGRLVEMRLVPLIVIGGLALRTVVARQAEKIRRQDGKVSGSSNL
jgi:hypothetical protein